MRSKPAPLSPELQLLMKHLVSHRRKRREEALAAVRRLSSDQLASLSTEGRQRMVNVTRRLLLYFNPILSILVVIPLSLLLLAPLRRVHPEQVDRFTPLFFLVFVGIPIAGVCYYELIDRTNDYLDLGDVIAERDDLCLLGPALDLHSHGYAWKKNNQNRPDMSLRPTIERLVKRLQRDDYRALTSTQQSTLREFLQNPNEQLSLLFAILEMLKTVRDPRAIKSVNKLLRQTQAEFKYRELHLAAQACLASLQSGQADYQEAESLLRASHAAESTADTLLRPVAGVHHSGTTDHLVRAVDAGGSCRERTDMS